MTPSTFLSIYQELIDENPFAVRAVLRILDVVFTPDTATLAVTCKDRPRLLVNLVFIERHCLTETHVKAVILHEFLHVLLRHTANRGPASEARHIAFDALINAIISRTQGEAWSSFFSAYYRDATGIALLLRSPQPEDLRRGAGKKLARIWTGLYAGRLVADDIEEIARDLAPSRRLARLVGCGPLIGNHQDLGETIPPALKEALQRAMREMNGEGVWRKPPEGLSHHRTVASLRSSAANPVRHWEQATLAILRRHVLPDRERNRSDEFSVSARLPVLSPGDRRAFLKSLWSPVLPTAAWDLVEKRPRATTQIYLDVSGSMTHEMPRLIALLGRLSGRIRRPFWAFSDVVAPARIEGGDLVTDTTGGTSLSCVLRHVLETRPAAAVIVTDGFIEPLDAGLVSAARAVTRLHTIVSATGSPAPLEAAGLPWTQLKDLPS
jgi:hypothetical protein